MADSTTPLPQMATGQASKEATFNALLDAASIAALYGRNYLTTAGLTWGYIGGRYRSTLVANGTVTLIASATNYIVAHRTTGAVTVGTSNTNWNNQSTYMRLYLVVAGASTVTSYEDHRYSLGEPSSQIDREIQFACSDLSTGIVVGTFKGYARALRAASSILGVRASLSTAQTSGSIFTIDININGASILSTKLTIDNGEKTSVTAATPAVLSSSSWSSDDEISADVDQVGDGTAKGLIVSVLYV